jgi:hypothetical protein
MFTSAKTQFFLTQTNRARYHDIYNYYMSSPSHQSYLKNYPTSELASNQDLVLATSSPNSQKKKITNLAMEELNNVKKFLLNYEKK